MKVRELTKEQFDKMPVYKGKYLHVSFVMEEKAIYDGQTYLIAYDHSSGEQLVGKDTTIAHMVKFYDLDEAGETVTLDEWKTSNGRTTLIKDSNRFTTQTLPAGTKYALARAATVVDGLTSAGTLAVRFIDVAYPSV